MGNWYVIARYPELLNCYTNDICTVREDYSPDGDAWSRMLQETCFPYVPEIIGI